MTIPEQKRSFVIQDHLAVRSTGVVKNTCCDERNQV